MIVMYKSFILVLFVLFNRKTEKYDWPFNYTRDTFPQCVSILFLYLCVKEVLKYKCVFNLPWDESLRIFLRILFVRRKIKRAKP